MVKRLVAVFSVLALLMMVAPPAALASGCYQGNGISSNSFGQSACSSSWNNTTYQYKPSAEDKKKTQNFIVKLTELFIEYVAKPFVKENSHKAAVKAVTGDWPTSQTPPRVTGPSVGSLPGAGLKNVVTYSPPPPSGCAVTKLCVSAK